MEYKTLGSLVDRKIGYGIVQPGQNILDGVPVIKVNNLITGLHSKDELDVTTKENDEKYSRTRLEGGELIVSVVGTVGKTAIVPKSFRGCNLVRAVAMIDIKENWLSKWVKYYIDSPAGQAYIEQNLNTTVQATLNIKTLVDMPIPFPKEDEMRKIVTILDAIDRKIECDQQINDNLAA
ncbi:restriction endonuclease subunit S [Faecalibacterium taiwanense]|jgi:type I restriction enzyme S subunit|uniref:restriction endonuclease subunit S n=1 Tax=Faecalibacterium taiwanense TaxID=3030638 RepID=UPI002FC6A9E4